MGLAGAIIGGVATIGGSLIASSGARSAANAQVDAANSANATQLQIFNQQRDDNAPWRTVGGNALYKLAGLYGVDTGQAAADNTDWAGYVNGDAGAKAAYAQYQQPASGWGGIGGLYGGGYNSGAPAGMSAAQFGQWYYQNKGNNADISAYKPAPTTPAPYGGFTASPSYQFRLDEGLKAIERSAAARGGLRSGATMKALDTYAQNTASQEFDNYANRLASLAGVGQTANAQNAAAGQNYANQSGANTMAAGQARASGYINSANAINGGIGNLASAYLYSRGYGGGAGGPNFSGVGYGGPIGSGGEWT